MFSFISDFICSVVSDVSVVEVVFLCIFTLAFFIELFLSFCRFLSDDK